MVKLIVKMWPFFDRVIYFENEFRDKKSIELLVTRITDHAVKPDSSSNGGVDYALDSDEGACNFVDLSHPEHMKSLSNHQRRVTVLMPVAETARIRHRPNVMVKVLFSKTREGGIIVAEVLSITEAEPKTIFNGTEWA